MTRLVTDGAEYRDLLLLENPTGDITVVASGQPIGSWCYRCDYGEGLALVRFPYRSEIYWRARQQYTSPSQADHPYLLPQIVSAGTEIASVRFSGSFPALYIGATRVALSDDYLNASVWYLFEGHLKIHPTDGVFELKIEGLPCASFYGNTQYLSITTMNGLGWTGVDGNVRGTNGQQLVDDIAINDVNGSEDNSWPGAGYIEALMPNIDGDTLQWTPTTSGSHFADLDEIPHDTDTTYVQALTTTTKRDMLNLFPYNNTDKIVTRVWTESRMRDLVSGGLVQVKLGVKTSGSVFVPETTKVLSNSYARVTGDEMKINPMTGLAWTKTDLDALQIVLEGDK